MRILIFGKNKCSKCITTRNKIMHFIAKWKLQVEIIYCDMDTVDGMAEGAYYDIWDIPGVIVEKNGKLIKKWMGEIPLSKDLKEALE